jgi:uncharacterized protein (DUF2141 family)
MAPQELSTAVAWSAQKKLHDHPGSRSGLGYAMVHLFMNLKRRPAKGFFLLAVCLLLVPNIGSAGESGTILVTIAGIRADQGGTLLVALFDAKGSWPKHESALRRQSLAVSDATQRLSFDQLPADRSYAVQVLHDRNRNGRLDFRWLPYPKPSEGVGVSNNNRRLGPPSFDKALFRLRGAVSAITIEMGY